MSAEDVAALRSLAHDVLGGAASDGGQLRDRLRGLDWHLVGIDAERGGAGGSLGDLLVLVEAMGYHAAPGPLAEKALAAWVGSSAGRDPAVAALAGPVRSGDRLTLTQGSGGLVLDGTVRRLPWGREAVRLLVYTGTSAGDVVVVDLDPRRVEVHEGSDLAGEPRDDLAFVAVPVVDRFSTPVRWEDVATRGMLLRAAMTVGLIERVVDLTTRHVNEREQFGRPLVRLQLVSARLALMAVARAEARAALDVGRMLDRAGAPDRRRVLCARLVVGRAADVAARLSHQLHGAVGTTEEHVLHRYTKRIWAWQDEWMAPAEVARELGAATLGGARGPIWPALVSWSGDGLG